MADLEDVLRRIDEEVCRRLGMLATPALRSRLKKALREAPEILRTPGIAAIAVAAESLPFTNEKVQRDLTEILTAFAPQVLEACPDGEGGAGSSRDSSTDQAMVAERFPESASVHPSAIPEIGDQHALGQPPRTDVYGVHHLNRHPETLRAHPIDIPAAQVTAALGRATPKATGRPASAKARRTEAMARAAPPPAASRAWMRCTAWLAGGAVLIAALVWWWLD